MKLIRPALPFVLALSASSTLALVQACSSDVREPDTIFLGADAKPPTLPGDGSLSQNKDGSSVSSTVRLVHAAPGLPAIDFCTRRGPQELFDGPVLGRDRPRDGGVDAARIDSASFVDAAAPVPDDADATPLPADDAAITDAGSAGVSPLSASQYLSIDGSGTLEIAIVPAGQGSCGQPLAAGQVTLEPGRLKTLVVHGVAQDGGKPTGVTAYDDTPDITMNRAKIRLIYAAGGSVPRLSATLYGTLTTTLGALDPLLPLKAEADASVVDGLGYASIEPRPSPITLGLLAEGSVDPKSSPPADFGLSGASVHTGFVVPSATGYSLLYCNDVSTDGPRTQCSVLALR